MWDPTRYSTLAEYVSAARAYPGDIVEMLEWATVEADIPYATFIETMINERILDVNRFDHWKSDDDCKTTLLLSALESRSTDNVRLLLSLGADVNIENERGYGVIDTVLVGHRASDLRYPEDCVALLKIVMPFNPPLKIDKTIAEELRMTDSSIESKHWSRYKKSNELMSILAPILKK